MSTTTLMLDNGDVIELPGPGFLDPALQLCKQRDLGGTLYRGDTTIAYVRRVASNGGWMAYYNEAGQEAS